MKTLLAISLIMLAFLSRAQDTINLREVRISSSRQSFNSGLRESDIDSTLLSQYNQRSLTDLLNENSAIYLKSYGPGALSTITLRGGSSYHTKILLNGFSIASPLNGLADLSLIRNFFIDDATILYGGAAPLWGSGSASGNILLSNKPSFDNSLHVQAGITTGSYSELCEHAGVAWSNKFYSGALKFFNENNTNNYEFEDKSTGEKKEQVHANIKQYGFMNDNYFRTGNFSTLNFRIWHTYSNREIPPTLLQVNNDAVQQDINTRLSAEWKYSKNTDEFVIRSGYFNEKINYNDDFLTEPSDNKSKSFINEVTYEKRFLTWHILQAGMNHTYSAADSSSNLNDASESRYSAFALYRYHSSNGKLETTAGIRKEYSSLSNSPFIISGGVNYNLFHAFQLKAAASNFYRNPTLNDLYWNPGGNSNLEPETGVSLETGFQLSAHEIPGLLRKNTSSSIVLNTTVYYKKINDWIIWYPSSSLQWHPQNLKEVKSRGIEVNLKYTYHKNKILAGIDFEFFYTKSTNEKSIYPNDASVGQQLIYVPLHRWNTHLFFLYRNTGFSFNHSYTGYRYTSSDNLSYLEPFTIDNLQIDQSFIAKNLIFKIYLSANNIFNTNYQSVQNRPMPLRNFTAGLIIKFQKQINQK